MMDMYLLQQQPAKLCFPTSLPISFLTFPISGLPVMHDYQLPPVQVWRCISIFFLVKLSTSITCWIYRVPHGKVCWWIHFRPTYRISSYSFRRNYSFLNLEIQRSQYIRPKVTVHKGVETIQGQKLYELLWGTIRYSKYGMFFATFHHILFWKVRSWSVRTGPENFGGPVRSGRTSIC